VFFGWKACWLTDPVVTEYTCFANNLPRLTRLRGPVRSLASPSDLRPDSHPMNAPGEIMRLINWLMSSNARDVWDPSLEALTRDADWELQDDMFTASPDETAVDTIREVQDLHFSTGSPVLTSL